eukprot:CAMPEP_0195284866 /NCGR_PEP_ID=MMETSP0707-20130614/2912_1 /TAXON_ID=33640 /ORGANISM="Asterionellopsis glacialis, Strain CCMP134" /LENGTH=542 /DNA_ID=CAMNT_0040344271 /DNA_START=575 /DNA_END=2204 /DNA_ORIENTATION=-
MSLNNLTAATAIQQATSVPLFGSTAQSSSLSLVFSSSIQQHQSQQYDYTTNNPFRQQRSFSSGRLLTIYKSRISSSNVQEDPHQLKALQELDRLRDEMLDWEQQHENNLPNKEQIQPPPLEPPLEPPSTLFSSSSWSNFFSGSSSSTNDTSNVSTTTTTTTTALSPTMPKGVYLHGGVGCGKTFCMNLLYESFTSQNSPYWYQQKQHVHFHKFMLNVHQHIHELKMVTGQVKGDPLPQVVERILEKGKLLCFDEFQVTDIADAMILQRLCTLLWDQGGIIVATSNRPPHDLYQNGIQRDLFLPFIPVLEQQCHVVSMVDSPIDYRLVQAQTKVKGGVFFTGPTNHERFDALFYKLTKQSSVHSTTLTTQGRHVSIPQCVMDQGMARFTFAELCQKALGAADYLVIGHHFHTVFVEFVPTLSRNELNWVRRFITFVDAMYECHVKVILHTLEASTPQELFVIERNNNNDPQQQPHDDEIFAFDRTQSRLEEMASTSYLQQRWKGAAAATAAAAEHHDSKTKKKDEPTIMTLETKLPQPSVSEE